MVNVHKRKKNSRIRGARTCGWGFRQKHKGHGNRGGHGMAGSGKRADHKKQKAKEMDTKQKKYFGTSGFTSRSTQRKKTDKLNLYTIKELFFKTNNQRIDLPGYTVLGVGEGFNANIFAKRASASALKKMQEAGGSITFFGSKEENTTKDKSEESRKEDTKESKLQPSENEMDDKPKKEKKKVAKKSAPKKSTAKKSVKKSTKKTAKKTTKKSG